ncbi:MAG: YtxH domain-containing protein [Alistipes sp.]|nr:YtxH domain-containing protein [Alistipes sp.]
MKKSSVCLLLALGGAVVGAAVAILVTPQSGRELRGKLRTAFNEAQHRMRHQCECDGDDCECDE